MRIFLLKRNTASCSRWRCSSSGERGRSARRRNLGKARTRSLLINTVLKSNPKIRKIFSRLYPEVNLLFFSKKKNYGPCNPGGGQDDISKIISNQYLSKQILLTLQPRWCLLEAVGTHGARVLCKNGENIMELYKILRNGGNIMESHEIL